MEKVEIDFLNFLEVISDLETSFNIEIGIDDEYFCKAITVQDFINFILSLFKQRKKTDSCSTFKVARKVQHYFEQNLGVGKNKIRKKTPLSSIFLTNNLQEWEKFRTSLPYRIKRAWVSSSLTRLDKSLMLMSATMFCVHFSFAVFTSALSYFLIKILPKKTSHLRLPHETFGDLVHSIVAQNYYAVQRNNCYNEKEVKNIILKHLCEITLENTIDTKKQLYFV
ncbi:hypothetical protein [Candidatus Uabimicrobium amorphum]|uniref:Acyl carrier protein n=1 Tax=Uabimicrobium amorphum TaxID=2596890 RepID=A0A5S9F3F1_UABAM|nr:hypothetical protein [Candidatus Uabimicrobium amorphum]BBM84422.1 acyl carrier protein [Candidatus Uabimicrobium amorphum]